MGLRTFDAIAGHHQALSYLRRALDRGRLAHALAFVGPCGVGRATVARALAAALLCPEAPRRACGSCRTCRRIATGRHPGFEVLTPPEDRRTISVEAARELRGRALAAPLEGPAHLVVVDPAEALTAEAANALLKVLEEPPEGVFFVILCASLRGILPTVASRCVPIRFGPLPAESTARILDEAAPNLLPEHREAVLGLAAGRPGKAIELAQDPSIPALLALLDAAEDAAGSGPAAIFAGKQAPVWEALTAAAKATGIKGTAGERRAAGTMLDLWALRLRRDLARCVGAPEQAAPIARILETVMETRTALERNGSVQLCMEDVLLRVWEIHTCAAA